MGSEMKLEIKLKHFKTYLHEIKNFGLVEKQQTIIKN